LVIKEILRYSNVSLNFVLDMNEKVEQYIKKKTHKTNGLRFWVGDGVIPFYKRNYVDKVIEFVSKRNSTN